MFSRIDLESLEQPQLTDGRFVACYPGLHYTVYPQHAFRVPDSEETIRITRAPKLHGDNGLRFWLSAEWARGWSGREQYMSSYSANAVFEVISEAEFNTMVAVQSGELLVPQPLPLHSQQGFVGALVLYSMKTDFVVSLFAEYEDEFIHFYWDTTA
jgi:hypothetical protein